MKRKIKLIDYEKHPYRSFFLSLPILALFPLIAVYAIVSAMFSE